MGTTTSIEIAGAILGIGRTKAYELARTGDFPMALIPAGRRHFVPVPALLALLDAPPAQTATARPRARTALGAAAATASPSVRTGA